MWQSALSRPANPNPQSTSKITKTSSGDASYSKMENGVVQQRSVPDQTTTSTSPKESEALLNGSSSSNISSSNGETYSKLNKFGYGASQSPRMYATLQLLRKSWESPRTMTAVSLVALIGVPLLTYGSLFPADSLRNFVIAIWTAWDGLLSIGSLLVMGFTIPGAFLFVELASSIPPTSSSKDEPQTNNRCHEEIMETCCSSKRVDNPEQTLSAKELAKKAKAYVFSTRYRLFNCVAGALLLWFLTLLGLIGPNSLVYPSWLWHPFLWGSYHVYSVDDVPAAMQHLCSYSAREDLCLNDKEWEILSAGTLSRHNRHDVRAVQAGQKYAKQNSIVINILARDVKENIPALKVNVESLAPLFKHVALVVFENDSNDGTREEFKLWAKELAGSDNKNYDVDVMECEGVVDCKLKRNYRDNVEDYDYSSAIGEMHTYRNMAVQYILNDPKYIDFSHLLVVDVDLGVPISPLGILHTLGMKPDTAVASSGRQPWPTAFGSFVTPYDLNGFREYNTERTMGLENWHRRFCGITPPGERWRNECDALAPTHLVAILWNDRKIIDGDFYRVRSAFNGAVLYPTNLLRRSGALYDKGDNGQRCEHVGFHDSINRLKPLEVNRKWDMHLMPNYPGGAAWGRAKKTTDRIMAHPQLCLTILACHVITVGIFVWATFTLGVYAIQPAVSSLLKHLSSSQGRKSRGNNNSMESDAEVKSVPRKANV